MNTPAPQHSSPRSFTTSFQPLDQKIDQQRLQPIVEQEDRQQDSPTDGPDEIRHRIDQPREIDRTIKKGFGFSFGHRSASIDRFIESNRPTSL
jgi:hypothetical protein